MPGPPLSWSSPAPPETLATVLSVTVSASSRTSMLTDVTPAVEQVAPSGPFWLQPVPNVTGTASPNVYVVPASDSVTAFVSLSAATYVSTPPTSDTSAACA